MTLKWKHVRTFVLLAAMILGMSSIFIYLSVLRPTPSEAEKTGFWAPAIFFEPIPGQEVSLDQAQASVPFKINLPTNMETPVQKILLPPQSDTPSVYIIYAVKLSSDASISDVLDQNGIILLEMSISGAYGTLQRADANFRALINETKDYPGGGHQPVTINGYFGYAGGNVEHCVGWATETTYYELLANKNYPLQQLVAIAQSIPIK